MFWYVRVRERVVRFETFLVLYDRRDWNTYELLRCVIFSFSSFFSAVRDKLALCTPFNERYFVFHFYHYQFLFNYFDFKRKKSRKIHNLIALECSRTIRIECGTSFGSGNIYAFHCSFCVKNAISNSDASHWKRIKIASKKKSKESVWPNACNTFKWKQGNTHKTIARNRFNYTFSKTIQQLK